MQTALVAGGAGFIGSYLCGKLLEDNQRVICVDDFSTGRKANISVFLDNPNFSFTKADVTESLLESFNAGRIDKIYHLASPADVATITSKPILAALANSIGTKNLLDLALKHRARFLFASSSEAYGDPLEHPQKEEYRGNVSSVGVRSGYDEGKRFGEALSMAYHRQCGLPVRIVRIFNTYGPNSRFDDSRVLPVFISRALLNQPLPVHGEGSQTRSFCFVSDMVNGIIKLMESEYAGPVNIGNPDEQKIIGVAKKVIELTGSSSDIIETERPDDDPSLRRPDIALAKKILNWQPEVSFDEGLKITLNYFRSLIAH